MTARHVHVLGICGYAISGAALLARTAGDVVTGSDEDAYPPVTDTLDAAGIRWSNGYSAENLDRWGRPDLVVVAAGVQPQNAEWRAAVERGLDIVSEAEFYTSLAEGRVRVAVCGTHGKTTTSALLVWMLERSGLDPGFRLGTTSRDLDATARLGQGPFVFEGDEYLTAPWDPRPKFLHIHPQLACVTAVEWDHPDMYANAAAYRAPFEELVRSMPGDGALVLCADTGAVSLGALASCRVVTYGHHEGAAWRIVADDAAAGGHNVDCSGDAADAPDGDAVRQHFTVTPPESPPLAIELPLPGAHNRLNATAALALAHELGAPLDACADACRTFHGAARRFEVLGRAAGVTVVDDYAHHPSEVRATLNAARRSFSHGRVLALFVPHTYSRTLTFLDDYATAFADADVLLLGPIEPSRERHLQHTVSIEDVAARARTASPDVRVIGSPAEAARTLADLARPGDVVVCMSVRGFDDVARQVLAALAESHAHR